MLRWPDSGPPAGPKYEAAIRGQMDLITCGKRVFRYLFIELQKSPSLSALPEVAKRSRTSGSRDRENLPLGEVPARLL